MHRFQTKREFRPSYKELRHDDSFRLKFKAFNTTFHLHLMPNRELFHHEAFLVIDNDNLNRQPLRQKDYRIYKGVVIPPHISDRQLALADIGVLNHLWEDEAMYSGWARIVVRHDIESTDTESLEKRHWRPKNGECAADDLIFNQMQSHRPSNTTYSKRDLREYMHLGQAGLVSLTKSIPPGYEFFSAADCTYTKFYNSIPNAMYQIFNDWNAASAVYESTFNVSLGLIEVKIMSSPCPTTTPTNETWNRPCNPNYPINMRLSDFSQWRGTKGDDGAGLWHLLTQCATGSKVGIAWLGQLCTTDVSLQQQDGGNEYVSGTGVSSSKYEYDFYRTQFAQFTKLNFFKVTREEWKVVAHEIGHGFGAIHDCTTATCPCQGDCGCCPMSSTTCDANSLYLMNPTSNVTTKQFSPCSQSYICNSMLSIGYCLRPPEYVNTKAKPICGNGIREPGEDCDSGGIDDHCCNGRTCKFKGNATCDDANDACCLNCKYKPSTEVCRPAASDCDIPEYCTGKAPMCPADVHLTDGVSCGNSTTLKCASGQCTSRDGQCLLRGGRMNISQACSYNSNTCQMNCLDPTDSSQCVILTGLFLNGTECGYGGYCQGGTCTNSSLCKYIQDIDCLELNLITNSTAHAATSWVDSHKSIAIPLFIILALLVLFVLFQCGVYQARAFQRRRILARAKQFSPKSAATRATQNSPKATEQKDSFSRSD
ncbi:hypothetical protein INT44_000441, partial [Umbelopsis vinacea]